LVLCVVAVWIDQRDSADVRSGVSASSGTGFPAGAAQTRAMLDGLVVARNAHGETSDRTAFGPGWAGRGGEPVLGDGCTARDAVLRRDLRELRMANRNPCMAIAGVADDPYTGSRLPYDRFKPSDIEIDHLVPLGDAWRSGAWAWTPQQRERIANDVDNLIAVQKQANHDKGSKSPDRWRPPRHEYWCEYARRWIGVKARYQLHVTQSERTALTAMLNECPA
jgi:hypothetical protein